MAIHSLTNSKVGMYVRLGTMDVRLTTIGGAAATAPPQIEALPSQPGDAVYHPPSKTIYIRYQAGVPPLSPPGVLTAGFYVPSSPYQLVEMSIQMLSVFTDEKSRGGLVVCKRVQHA
jgi:hypothetical protein